MQGCPETMKRGNGTWERWHEIDPDSVASLIARLLKRRGVERVFALCGGHIMPIWMRLDAEGIRIIDVRDERAAVHMAQAHAELTGELGVALVTAGPGVTNAMTGIANAHVSRAPVLVVSGTNPTAAGEPRRAAGPRPHPARPLDHALRPHRARPRARARGARRGDLAGVRRGRRARPFLHRLPDRRAAPGGAQAGPARGAPPGQATRRSSGPTRRGSPRRSICCGARSACSSSPGAAPAGRGLNSRLSWTGSARFTSTPARAAAWCRTRTPPSSARCAARSWATPTSC